MWFSCRQHGHDREVAFSVILIVIPMYIKMNCIVSKILSPLKFDPQVPTIDISYLYKMLRA
jgi:hypothetical protein